ncbi:RNA polymerase sigma factor region1.1 domain-containing protein [Methylobacterium sp. JK268]
MALDDFIAAAARDGQVTSAQVEALLGDRPLSAGQIEAVVDLIARRGIVLLEEIPAGPRDAS